MTVKLGLVSLVLALLAASGLYTMKDQVQRREAELRGLEVAVAAERAALGRLRAEWAMLNQPSRIARLAAAYLELQPALPGQIVTVEDIPLRLDLELAERRLMARLPSGGEVPLRLKPAERLVLPALQGGALAAGRQHARSEAR
jgi:hypothetical protein